ncbi:MAG: hypothetical protein ACT4OU_03515 [Hyphomicrobium sp.]
MTDNGDRYALSALRNKRGSLAGEIVQLERKLRHCREAIKHVDATLRLLDPSGDPTALPKKRPPQRIKLFRQGELGRHIRDALRTANGAPVLTADIVTYLLKVGGHGEDARAAMAPRVRGNLAYLERREVVRKTQRGSLIQWALV